MSNSLPVPSKGALRALRNLALGTSCTVAVTAGLLTEDRRRRIHAARAVQQNGQRIKGSKSYHESAAAVAIAALEEHVLSPEYFSSTEERQLLPPAGTWRSESISTHYAHEVPAHTPAPPPVITPKHILPAPAATRPSDVVPPPSWLNSIKAKSAEVPAISSINSATRTASSLLLSGRLSDTLQSINVVLDLVQKHVKPGEAYFPYKICNDIYEQCVQQSNIHAYLPLLQELFRGPVSEIDYCRLHAPATALHLLRLRASQTGAEDNAKYMQAAISIFLKRFKPSTVTAVCEEIKRGDVRDTVLLGRKYMDELASILPAAAFEAQLWEKTVEVCKTITKSPEIRTPASATVYNILANHEMGNDYEVIKIFRSDFATSKPSSRYHNRVVTAALESAFKQRRVSVAEDVVVIAAEKAREGGFRMGVTLFNKVLGHQWRRSKDLAKTKAFFERLEAFVDVLNTPEALYCTMMQICIEAGDEASAWSYFDKQVSVSEDIALTVQLRTSGHLALASSIRGDWVEARDLLFDLISTAEKPAERKVVSEVFPPIFKLFAARHSADDTETFLKEFLKQGLQLHSYAFNIMINKFASEMDMNSINRFLLEAPQQGIAKPDATTFNSILSSLRDEWALPFEDLFTIVREMKNKDAAMVDGITFNILRDQLIRDARGNRMHFSRHLRRLENLLPGHGDTGSHSPESDLEIMRAVIAKGSNVKALKHYDYVFSDPEAHISPNVFGLAIKACLDMGSSNTMDVAMQMLADAKERGVDISQGVTRLLLWRIEDPNSGWKKGHLKAHIHGMMSTLTEQGIEVSINVIVHMGNLLCDRGAHDKALGIWEEYMADGKVEQRGVSISCLTMLLRANLQTRSTEGLQWIMQTISMNKLTPDKSFMTQLKFGRRNVKKALFESEGKVESHREFLAVLEAMYERLKAQRASQVKKSSSATARLMGIMQEAVEAEKSQATDVEIPARKQAGKHMTGTVRRTVLPFPRAEIQQPTALQELSEAGQRKEDVEIPIGKQAQNAISGAFRPSFLPPSSPEPSQPTALQQLEEEGKRKEEAEIPLGKQAVNAMTAAFRPSFLLAEKGQYHDWSAVKERDEIQQWFESEEGDKQMRAALGYAEPEVRPKVIVKKEPVKLKPEAEERRARRHKKWETLSNLSKKQAQGE